MLPVNPLDWRFLWQQRTKGNLKVTRDVIWKKDWIVLDIKQHVQFDHIGQVPKLTRNGARQLVHAQIQNCEAFQCANFSGNWPNKTIVMKDSGKNKKKKKTSLYKLDETL